MKKIRLCDIDTCTQCQACVSICPVKCISMQEARDGFSIPIIDRTKCIECIACMKSCHKINPISEFQQPLKTYACWTKKSTDRHNSSSGGAFSILARKILEEEGKVYGAFMNDRLMVEHIGIENSEDLALLQGSKYLQSNTHNIYSKVRDDLKKGRKILFSGTPCQIAGLYNYLKNKPENLFTCDVVCHGVPSQKAFDIYIDKIGMKGNCRKFNFRFTEGWGFQLSTQHSNTQGSTSKKKKIVSPKNCYYL
ncbi:MAG: Coenzyme F420 hydrogenase/dehydrogenase, beta subunit C-terminal domain, partial [Prevotella sp.]|nr:Coenzyme F420 hydrogenase/dehydrogenase, beta subunit C-terminal domain [Prevotella sp.]